LLPLSGHIFEVLNFDLPIVRQLGDRIYPIFLGIRFPLAER
jgi:hypothetical protein